jgi:hypothetical protein
LILFIFSRATPLPRHSPSHHITFPVNVPAPLCKTASRYGGRSGTPTPIPKGAEGQSHPGAPADGLVSATAPRREPLDWPASSHACPAIAVARTSALAISVAAYLHHFVPASSHACPASKDTPARGDRRSRTFTNCLAENRRFRIVSGRIVACSHCAACSHFGPVLPAHYQSDSSSCFSASRLRFCFQRYRPVLRDLACLYYGSCCGSGSRTFRAFPAFTS